MSSFAQQKSGNIKGTVIDGISKAPFEFVYATLYNTDGELITGSLTDSKGNFSIDNVGDGSYLLEISFMGYKADTLKVVVSPSQRNVRLKPVTLQEDAQLLDEVQVTGQVTQMRMDVDKKIFMVNEGALSAGAGTTEILQNIPSVDVDNEGNVSLRNNENVEVWINGKPSGLTTDNRAQILEQLPAESVESVEIITNPSAKYNPEGSAGIINIVLKKNRKEGYSGSVSGGVSYPLGFNVGANFNYNKNKIDTYLNISFRRNRNEGGGYNRRTSFGDDIDTTYLRQTNESETTWQSAFIRTGINYQLNERNNFGIGVYGMLGNRRSETDYRYTLLDNNYDATEHYTQNTSSDRDNHSYNINADYKHEFVRKGHELTANAVYSVFNSEGSSDYVTKRDNADRYRHEEMDRTSRGLSVQADYVLPLQEKMKIEAGYKSGFSWYDNQTSENEIETDDFSFRQQIHSLYVNYKGEIKTIGFQLGLRGEETYVNWENEDGKGSTSPYFNLFPSLFLTKTFAETNEVQLSVTRRINRPHAYRLNPYRDMSDPTQITYGNPDLSPEVAWAYEANYLKIWEQHTLSASAYFRHTDDIIQSVSTLHEYTPEYTVVETTYDNISSSYSTGAEFTLKNKFKSILELTSTFNLYYYKMNGNEAYDIKSREDFAWNAKMIANISFKKGFSGQITGSYQAPRILAQGKRFASYSVDMGVKKVFFKQLTVNLSARDILDSRRIHTETYGDNFTQETERYRQGRNFALTASYTFGNLNKKENRKKSTENGFDMDGGEM